MLSTSKNLYEIQNSSSIKYQLKQYLFDVFVIKTMWKCYINEELPIMMITRCGWIDCLNVDCFVNKLSKTQ